MGAASGVIDETCQLLRTYRHAPWTSPKGWTPDTGRGPKEGVTGASQGRGRIWKLRPKLRRTVEGTSNSNRVETTPATATVGGG